VVKRARGRHQCTSVSRHYGLLPVAYGLGKRWSLRGLVASSSSNAGRQRCHGRGRHVPRPPRRPRTVGPLLTIWRSFPPVRSTSATVDGAVRLSLTYRIRPEEIEWGGVKKDGIPALDRPGFVAASETTFWKDDERVFGIYLGGEARAYPHRILDAHEMANDVVGGRPISTPCSGSIPKRSSS
jgi:hypothetical protein